MRELDSLPYNQVSMKAAHNSYQRDEEFIDQLTWHPNKPYNGGCRALELDISQSKDGKQWSVGHKSSYDGHYRQLSQFLSELSVYSRNNPGHDVVTLHLDLKHVECDFPDKLDTYIRGHLDVDLATKVYTPGALMQDAATLSQGAEKYGWPSLSDLKSHFIICLSGDKEAKETYARTNPKSRLCFADKDMKQDEDPRDEDRVFFNYHLFSDDKNKWQPVFRRAASRKNVIIRGYVLNGKDLWNAALDSGCNLLATDKISNHDWAKVGDTPFVKRKSLL